MQGDTKFDHAEVGGEVNGAVIIKPTEFFPDFGGKVL
jgi:hypothetical protein